MKDEERILRVALATAPGIGPVTLRRLLSRFGPGFEDALDRRPAQVAASLRLTRRAASSLVAAVEPHARAEAAELIARVSDRGGQILLLGEPDFPSRLAAVRDAPAVLFLIGRAEVLKRERAVAVVGARDAAPESLDLARELAAAAAGSGAAVISGLAAGVDSAAHRGALERQGPTAAVVAAGPELAFPPENEALHRQLCADGAVVSEQPPGTRTEAHLLVRRNRWIAALADAVVVVEAAARSGALHAAAAARDYDRALFAVDRGPASRYAGNAQLLAEGARSLEPHAGPEQLVEALR